MIADRNPGNTSPLTWVGTFPVYFATALAGAQLAAMILTTVALAVAGGSELSNPVLAPLVFSWQTAAIEGRLWQFLTYAFVNPPSFWVVIQIILLGVFGRELEKFLGRRQFGLLYLALVLAGPLLLCAAGLMGYGLPLVGSSLVNFGVFVAFAILYPRAEILFSLQARWVAAALVGIYSLQGLAGRAFLETGILWWTCGVAFFFLRWEGIGSFPQIVHPQKKPKAALRVPAPRETGLHESVDSILEKISRSGIASLTREERARLERARAALIEKESGSTP